MKTKIILTALIGLLAASILIFQACKKDEAVNQAPTCKITAPANWQEIAKGETVIITVETSDSDGSITEVRFSIDGIEKGSASSYPYNYNWATSSESIGNHKLIAISFDNSGSSTSDEISVVIADGGNSTGTFTDSRDGQIYNTITIGIQTWFAENLNFETTNSWWYDNSATKGDKYGRLYTGFDAKTACPDGWHLPSDDEWKILEMSLGMSQSEVDATGTGWRGTDEGKKLKSTSGWYSNGNGTDTVGFTALPGGTYTVLEFVYLGNTGKWWSNTNHGSTYAWTRNLFYYDDRLYREYGNMYWGYSVRCVRD